MHAKTLLEDSVNVIAIHYKFDKLPLRMIEFRNIFNHIDMGNIVPGFIVR